MRTWLLRALLLASMVPLASAQVDDRPHGMYCGGNMLIYEGKLTASTVSITVVDPAGYHVWNARVQVQMIGRNDIIFDREANAHGRLKLRRLRPGEYWLGVSARGFNLHYWHLSKSWSQPDKALRVVLTLGT